MIYVSRVRRHGFCSTDCLIYIRQRVLGLCILFLSLAGMVFALLDVLAVSFVGAVETNAVRSSETRSEPLAKGRKTLLQILQILSNHCGVRPLWKTNSDHLIMEASYRWVRYSGSLPMYVTRWYRVIFNCQNCSPLCEGTTPAQFRRVGGIVVEQTPRERPEEAPSNRNRG